MLLGNLRCQANKKFNNEAYIVHFLVFWVAVPETSELLGTVYSCFWLPENWESGESGLSELGRLEPASAGPTLHPWPTLSCFILNTSLYQIKFCSTEGHNYLRLGMVFLRVSLTIISGEIEIPPPIKSFIFGTTIFCTTINMNVKVIFNISKKNWRICILPIELF